jgi:hypothetical protein
MLTSPTRLTPPGVALLLAALPLALPAQEYAPPVQPNARGAYYADTSRCQRGFEEVAGTCVPFSVPANGYATHTRQGQGWECKPGFRQVNGACLNHQ